MSCSAIFHEVRTSGMWKCRSYYEAACFFTKQIFWWNIFERKSRPFSSSSSTPLSVYLASCWLRGAFFLMNRLSFSALSYLSLFCLSFYFSSFNVLFTSLTFPLSVVISGRRLFIVFVIFFKKKKEFCSSVGCVLLLLLPLVVSPPVRLI